jgi:hypothetical protein
MFNINEFKSTMNKYGGPAKTNLFEVRLSGWSANENEIKSFGPGKKADYIPIRDLTFFCSEVSLPSLNMQTTSYRANVIDLPQSMPTNLSTPSINATFMLDSDHRVVSFFHSWFQEIINYDSRNSLLSSINGDHMPYEIGYKDDYQCTMEIIHHRTDSTGETGEAYVYEFNGVYPTEVGSKVFSWAPSDSIATMTVNFTASSYSFTASDPGSVSATLSRGQGYLDILNSVGFKGQTIRQSNLPRSIQDAINTFTTVRNDFRTIKNTFRSFRNNF